ncbi:LAlv9 family protein [Aaosphaeria arxii CBS 175.79]|uniref:LAlv9 family protein n=1 Tax=Aaosphaeria arxii CBS 175.79 TaxID=1450172 RepID=A0A6A5XB52_9PLEO|nr:LAlv9 family protein [Aaosphaeria arxii CBS 175.79]KAF2010305.1 LAlv9 family protein [Aaosphaeria arxii CBS 175.79]
MAPFAPIVCIVDFHHARGPEVETWLGVEEGTDPASDNDWSLLPFMALSDGAHASTEDYSYFTLRREATENSPATSLFGISCTRQLDASELINRPADVTRSTVQKAVVVISDSPQHFGAVKAQLGVVTAAWFAQKDFTDMEIMQRFQESLPVFLKNQEGEMDHYFGISLRELIHEFKWQTLVLFKCALLQPKMLFFGSHCERLCMMQFALISLIPGLIRQLQDSADPKFNSYEENLVMPTSLRTSERSSLLAYMGLPLQLFGKGSLFGPYTPLQQLDMLADKGTKSYIVGSTNSLLLQQRDRYSDVLINLDDLTLNVTSTSLRTALVLSTPDRRWMDFLTQTVYDTWDESNPSRPKDHGYAGSEEFIRMQFEEYLLALLSAVKCKLYLEKNKEKENLIPDIEGDPAADFSNEFIDAWMKTENFRLFNKFTDSHLFDIVDPKHPCSGGLTIEDVQRRLAQQVAEMHLDERLEKSREAIGKQFAVGQKKVSSVVNNLWAEMDAMREAQRKRQEEQRLQRESEVSSTNGEKPAGSAANAQANVPTASSRAGAYLSSWGAWASEKKKGWAAARSTTTTPLTSPLPQAEPTPGDLRRAEEFEQKKKGVSTDIPLSSARTVPVDVEASAAAANRESLFFDAEKEREKEKRSKDAEQN